MVLTLTSAVRGVHVYDVEIPIREKVVITPSHHKKFKDSMNMFYERVLAGHVAGEYMQH